MLNDIIKDIRVYLNDVERMEYKDEELITYCNDALEFIEDGLAQYQSSINLEHLEVTETPYEIPYSLLKIDKLERDGRDKLLYRERTVNVADGEYSLVGGNIYISEKDLPVDLYFHSKLQRFEGIQEDGVYTEELGIYYPLIGIVKQYALIKALNRLEYTSKDEEAKLAELSQALVEVIRRRDGLVGIDRNNGFSGGLCRR